MDLRRFAFTVVIMGGILAFVMYSAKQGAPKQKDDKTPTTAQAVATAPATAPAPRSTTAPTTGPTSAPAPAHTPTTAPSASAATRPAGAEIAANRPEWKQSPFSTGKYTIGSLDRATGYFFEVEAVPDWAAIRTIKLSRHFARVKDKQEYLRDPKAYEKSPKRYAGHYSLLNPVESDSAKYLPLATRKVTLYLKKADGWDKDASFTWPGRGEKLQWRRVKPDPTASRPAGSESITFEWSLYRDVNRNKPKLKGDWRKFLTLRKTYTVRKKDHSIGVELRLINHTGKKFAVTIDQYGPIGPPREDVRGDGRFGAYGRLKKDQSVSVMIESLKNYTDMPLGKRKDLGTSNEKEPILWVGVANKFFGSMMYLQPKEKGRLQAPSYRAKFYMAPVQEASGTLTFLPGVELSEMAVSARVDRPLVVRFDLFAGAKDRNLLKNNPLYAKLDYFGMITFSSCCSFCAWDWLSLAMMWLLDVFARVAFGNYGVAIIMLVILVRLGMHPLTKKGQVAMMGMQKLQPEIAKMREKYKDDKEAMNREMMALYKQHGAGPLLGCLPMLIQMPIWIALWTGINAAVALRHAAFLPVWITDLAAPDALVSWSPAVHVPILSWLIGPVTSFNLLPILLCAGMVLQQKFTPQAAAADDDKAKSQRKMMMWMMPIMMVVFFYQAPSGLTLYIMASTFFGVAEQYVIRKHIKAQEEAEAMMETRVQMPGKAPRASRPKKPKGPFWTKNG